MTDERPRPRYGEYAPVEPSAPPRPEDRLDLPGGPADGPRSGWVGDPASGPVGGPAGGAGASDRPDAARRVRWDLPVTVGLLALGVYDVATSWRELADLAGVVGQVFEQQGIGAYTALDAAATIGLVANVARVALLVIVIAISLARIRTARRAVVVPLIGGALGAVILFAAIVAAMLVDPAFVEFMSAQIPA